MAVYIHMAVYIYTQGSIYETTRETTHTLGGGGDSDTEWIPTAKQPCTCSLVPGGRLQFNYARMCVSKSEGHGSFLGLK